jgi:hypothetical protein
LFTLLLLNWDYTAGNEHCLWRQSYFYTWRFGSIAFGIGTSQVAQVFASQSLLNKPKSMRITVNGKLNENVQPKDVIFILFQK